MSVLKRKLSEVHYPEVTKTVTESYQHCVQVPPTSQPHTVTNPGTGPSTNDPAAPNPGVCYTVSSESETFTTGSSLGGGRHKVCATLGTTSF